MAKPVQLTWLTGAQAIRLHDAGLRPPRGPFAYALVCDVRDPALAALANLALTDADLADERTPSASARTHFRARRSLLRALAAAALGVSPTSVRIAYDSDGAPRVDGLPAFVSVSSRGPLAALSVASSPLGIDLEPFDASAEPVDAVLHPREQAMLAELAGPARARAFLRIWTAKEAYLKALGRGFKRDPATIAATCEAAQFSIDDGGPAPLPVATFAPPMGLGDLIVACAVTA